MAFDEYFTSKVKAPVPGKALEFAESVEFQLGRSDAKLGTLACPFPPGYDADEWKRGWKAEKESWSRR